MIVCTLMWMMLASVIISNAAAPPELCTEPEGVCKENKECCTGCCQEHKCAVTPEACVSEANNPCYLYACPPGKVCYLATVECLQSPCQPIPACKVDDSDYD